MEAVDEFVLNEFKVLLLTDGHCLRGQALAVCHTFGKAEDNVTSGLEGAWTATPTPWTMHYLSNLYAFEWGKTKNPVGAIQ